MTEEEAIEAKRLALMAIVERDRRGHPVTAERAALTERVMAAAARVMVIHKPLLDGLADR